MSPSSLGLPSPMATPHFLSEKRRSSSSSTATKVSATEALTAVFQRDQLRERKFSPPSSFATPSATPVSTPALSLNSAATTTTTASSRDEDITSEDEFDDGLSYPPAVSAPTSFDKSAEIRHAEFGHCNNESYRFVSRHPPGSKVVQHVDEAPYFILIATYLSYLCLIAFGHLRDFFGKIFNAKNYQHLMPSNGYAALNSDFDNFYVRRLKLRLEDCFSRPICSVPGRTVTLLDRGSDNYNKQFYLTGGKTRALNVSSYNYLGFAQSKGGCTDAVEECIKRYGWSAGGSRAHGGSLDLHIIAENLVAKFVGHEAALIGSMGFATNGANIPAFVSKGCIVLSDELNHASIRYGVRVSGASVRMFKHNDMQDLEKLLREVISQGQPRTHRPWKKILVIVEGLYSMEGTMCDLPNLLKLKERYKFYLYIDEAHSIGALGPNGRGVCDFFGVDPRKVDILMGTFTKSFGAAGGYIAGSKELITHLRIRSHASVYSESMPPPVLTQIIASTSSIMSVDMTPPSASSASASFVPVKEVHPGPAPASYIPPWVLSCLRPQQISGLEGQTRLQRLAFNARYLHRALKKLGFITYGHAASPIVPLLLFNPAKMPGFSRFMLQRRVPIVVVVVGYPATPLVTSRVRFCLSAAHTKEDVDLLLEACDEIGEWMDLKRGLPKSERWPLEMVKARAVELAELP